MQGGFEFGRAEECSVRIQSPKASRRHAVIHVQERATRTEYWLFDPGSANGSFVNGRRVSQPLQLCDGDRIRIADQEFIFHMRSTEPGCAPSVSSDSTMWEARSGPGWLLVTDIVNSTVLVQKLAADQLATTLARWLRACAAIIEKGEGTVCEHRGDGLLAYWQGGPRAVELVAATMRELRAEQKTASPAFRVVLHHGDFTITTEPLEGTESLIGSAVHYVFRAEKLAVGAGSAMIFSTAAAEAIGRRLPFIPLAGEFEMKGFEGRHSFMTLGD